MSHLTELELEERARLAYEAITERLRHHTAAAWVRWEDLPAEGRAIWINAVRVTEDPDDC